MKLYTNSKEKSFGGSVYYNSNKNLNLYLQKQKSKKQLCENGFKVVNCPISKAIKEIESKHEVWLFPPKQFTKTIDKAGFKHCGIVFSHYGENLKKWKCQDGNVYLYSVRIPILDTFGKVYVFTDKNRKVIKELWVTD